MGWCHLLVPGEAFSIPAGIRSSFLTAGGWHGVVGRKMRWFRMGCAEEQGHCPGAGVHGAVWQQDECLWFAPRLGGMAGCRKPVSK